MATILSIGQLSENLAEILERVRSGERFRIECDGSVIAVLAPPAVEGGITGRQLAAALRRVPRPDDKFADDLAAIHTAQGLVGITR